MGKAKIKFGNNTIVLNGKHKITVEYNEEDADIEKHYLCVEILSPTEQAEDKMIRTTFFKNDGESMYVHDHGYLSWAT